jgi:hypothetical protein
MTKNYNAGDHHATETAHPRRQRRTGVCPVVGRSGRLARQRPSRQLRHQRGFLYFDALEGSENVQVSAFAEFAAATVNDQTRVLSLGAGDKPRCIKPSPVDAGVRVNTRSSGWVASELAESGFAPMPVVAGDGPLWLVRSTTPRFTWLEPRAARPLAAGKQQQTSWRIPYVMRTGTAELPGEVQGTTQWIVHRPERTADSSAS